MPEPPPGDLFEIRLRARPSAIPVQCRLKALLKFAGRQLDLACLSITVVKPAVAPAAVAPNENESTTE